MLSYNPYYENYLMHYGVKGRSGRKPGSRNADNKSKAKQIATAVVKHPNVQNAINTVQNSQYAKTAARFINDHPEITEKVKNTTISSINNIDKKKAAKIIAAAARTTVKVATSKKRKSTKEKVYDKTVSVVKKILK